jgi:hypothetical protein
MKPKTRGRVIAITVLGILGTAPCLNKAEFESKIKELLATLK